MSFSNLLMIFPESPGFSALFWIAVATLVLYLARTSAHLTITSLSQTLHNAMRLAARSLRSAESRLAERNREVLLAAGREAAERMLEREFDRVDAAVRRDLGDYPALQRRLNEEIARIDQDYQDSGVVPPVPSEWVKAIEAVATIPASGDSMVSSVLGDIRESMEQSQREALTEYRSANSRRHEMLKRMLPQWRRLLQLMGRVDKNVAGLLQRSRSIDRHIEEYESVMQRTDRAERTISSSSLTQFFVAGFVLLIAVGGAMINFNLIARPMQEMVGGGSYLMGFQVSNIAALVIILVELAMGIFLMESLRITRLFPVIGALDDRVRVRMAWVTFTILLILASMEAGLAYMREILSQDDAALVASLVAGAGPSAASANQSITTTVQMGIGFILPFALTFVALPLESFVHSSRTVLGVLAVGSLRMTAFLLRLLGNVFRYAGTMLKQFYDLLIFGPLWLERHLGQGKPASAKPASAKSGDPAIEQIAGPEAAPAPRNSFSTRHTAKKNKLAEARS